MGDFNAKVGVSQNEEEVDLIGSYTIGERNRNGEYLAEFAVENQFILCNTMFEKHPRRLYTWTSPDGLTKNQIDYILIQKRWKTSVLNTKTNLKADCNSDHELLEMKFRVRLKTRKSERRPIRYDMSSINEEFKVEVKNRFACLAEIVEDKEPDFIANEAKNIFNEAASKHLKPRRFKKSMWISESTLEKIEERKKLKQSHGIKSEEYKRSAREIKMMCKRDKKQYIIKKCEKIEGHLQRNESKEMFSEINSMRATFRPKLGVIKDEEGKTLTEADDIIRRWERYCSEMFKSETNNPIKESVPAQLQSDKEEDEPLPSEIEWAIKSLKDGKSPGCDNITSEMIKAAGEEGQKIYLSLCRKIWQTKRWPTDWQRAVFIVLPKKGDLQLCSNYRTISLISHASKILLKIITKRMEAKLEEEISNTQAGFRKNRGTRDHIFNLRVIIEKCREIQNDLHICFIDYSKAFDCVIHEKLWDTMYVLNFNENIIKLVQNLYIGQQSAVRLECGTTNWFSVERGVRQGCILSPHLFSIYTEGIMREVENDQRKEEYDILKMQGTEMLDLRYADDTALMSKSPQGLEQLILSVKEHSEEKGLKLNVKKTKILDIDKSEQTSNIFINQEKVENVNHFEYLGFRIESNNNVNAEIRRRLAIAMTILQKMDKIWKGEQEATKLRIIRACVFPIATYGCEGWTVGKTEEKKITSFELKCYRKMLKIPWTDKVRNEAILNRLHIQPNWLLNTVKRRKLQYFGHIKRHDGLEKHIMEASTQGRRGRGRPARRWLDDIRSWMGTSATEVGRMAQERSSYRQMVWEATTQEGHAN